MVYYHADNCAISPSAFLFLNRLSFLEIAQNLCMSRMWAYNASFYVNYFVHELKRMWDNLIRVLIPPYVYNYCHDLERILRVPDFFLLYVSNTASTLVAQELRF